MSFKVRILGSGSAIPTSRRNPSSQHVMCCNRSILIDCGEGTQLQLRKFGVKFQRIEHILISHLHGDHYFGLIGLMSTMHLLGRVHKLNIYGPEPLESVIRTMMKAGNAHYAYDIEFHTIEEGARKELFSDDKISIHTFPLIHKIPTNGFLITEKEKPRKLLAEKAEKAGIPLMYLHRLKNAEDVITDDGLVYKYEDFTEPGDSARRYAYCSDTRYTESILDDIREVDLLYHEATFVDHLKDRAIETKHSTASEAAHIAKIAGVKQLLLGHISARYDSGELHLKEAQAIFSKSFVVEDGEEFEIT